MIVAFTTRMNFPYPNRYKLYITFARDEEKKKIFNYSKNAEIKLLFYNLIHIQKKCL
jgi:hypothetical protein